MNALEQSREATGDRHDAGDVVGPRRPEERLMGLDRHTHRRRLGPQYLGCHVTIKGLPDNSHAAAHGYPLSVREGSSPNSRR